MKFSSEDGNNNNNTANYDDKPDFNVFTSSFRNDHPKKEYSVEDSINMKELENELLNLNQRLNQKKNATTTRNTSSNNDDNDDPFSKYYGLLL